MKLSEKKILVKLAHKLYRAKSVATFNDPTHNISSLLLKLYKQENWYNSTTN